jgi:hypothetical protein
LYSRLPAGSAFRAYRFETRVDASPSEACDAAMSFASSPDRSPAGQNRTILAQTGDSLLVYTHVELPLVADRETTTRIAKRIDTAANTCRLEWGDANDEGPPPTQGRVRIVDSRGFWQFEPIAAGGEREAHVVYESYANPGGRIPAWIINSAMSSSLADQIDGLRDVIDERREATPEPR